MRRIRKRSKRQLVTFWDVEAPRRWDRAELVCWVREDGERGYFEGADCLRGMKAHAERERGIYVAHYGGGYDTLLMLNVWPMAELHLTGSNVLCARDALDLEFRDSFPWWLAGLAKVGKAVGLEKLDVDRARLHELTTAQLREYCMRDCEIGMRGTEAAWSFLDERNARRAWTAGSSACNLLRALEPGSWGILKANRVDAEHAREFLTNANVGARVEAWVRGEVSPVYCYDVKSSYPARYATRPLPFGMRRAAPGERPHIGLYRWRWHDRSRIPPALDRGSQAGVGECSGWLVDDEVEAFEECGVSPELVEGWCGVEVAHVGGVFVDELYRAKEESGPGSFFSKVWLNSLHGRYMMRPLREKFTRWRPREWWGPIPPSPVGLFDEPQESGDRGEPLWWRYWHLDVGDDGLLRPTQQPLAGALILGRARVALWRIVDAVHRAGWRVFYSDTDSLHTDAPPDEVSRIVGAEHFGKKLGQLAYEGGPYEGIYLGPKAYLLRDADGVVQKQALKGVPLKSYADALVGVDGAFRQARGTERGVDLRTEVFKAALGKRTRTVFSRGPDVGALCRKSGLNTFLRGVAQSEDDDRPRWQTNVDAPRLIRPTSRGKVAAPDGFLYLSSLELVARDLAERASRGGRVDDCEERSWLLSRGLLTEDDELTAAGREWLAFVRGETALTARGRDTSRE